MAILMFHIQGFVFKQAYWAMAKQIVQPEKLAVIVLESTHLRTLLCSFALIECMFFLRNVKKNQLSGELNSTIFKYQSLQFL